MVSELDRLLEYGSYEDVKSYIERNPLLFREQRPDNGTLPLHRVLCAFLIAVGARERGSVSISTSQSPDFLHRKEKVQLLIETYPQGPTIKDHDGHIPLHAVVGDYWCKFGQPWESEATELSEYVLKAFSAATHFRDSEGKSPLEYAISVGNSQQATYLLHNHWVANAIPAVHCPCLESHTHLTFIHGTRDRGSARFFASPDQPSRRVHRSQR